MKTYFKYLKLYAIAGFSFFIPVVVIFLILAKAFNALNSTGTKIAGWFGHSDFLGMGLASFITLVLLVIICLFCGFLMIKYSFMKQTKARIEATMEKYIPGYHNYKQMAEEAVLKKEKPFPHLPAFLNLRDGSFKPVFLIEKNDTGDCVILVPESPNSPAGQVMIVEEQLLTVISGVSGKEFNGYINNAGIGLLQFYQTANGS